MLLHMQGYIFVLVALGTKHCSSSSVKHQFPSQRTRFDSRKAVKTLELKLSSLIALVKFQRAMGVFHHSNLVGNY